MFPQTDPAAPMAAGLKDGSTLLRGYAPRAELNTRPLGSEGEELQQNSASALAIFRRTGGESSRTREQCATSCPASEPVPQTPPRPQGALGAHRGPTYRFRPKRSTNRPVGGRTLYTPLKESGEWQLGVLTPLGSQASEAACARE